MSVYNDLMFYPVLITDLFEVHNGSGSKKKDKGNVPYIAASFQSNGVVGFVDNPKYPGGWLSLVKDGDGGAGTCFYQPAPFWPSNHVLALEPKKDNLGAPTLVCLAAIITNQCFPKYNRGNAINSNRLSRQKIMVPCLNDTDGNLAIDWSGLDRLGKELFSEIKKSAAIALE